MGKGNQTPVIQSPPAYEPVETYEPPPVYEETPSVADEAYEEDVKEKKKEIAARAQGRGSTILTGNAGLLAQPELKKPQLKSKFGA